MVNLSRKQQRCKRHLRIRKRVSGTATVPRMSVCVTGKHLYVQMVDDHRGHTMVSVSTLDPKLRADKIEKNCKGAQMIGKIAAEKALAAGIKSVVFDRGGYKYHGRVKCIADAAREGGLKF